MLLAMDNLPSLDQLEDFLHTLCLANPEADLFRWKNRLGDYLHTENESV